MLNQLFQQLGHTPTATTPTRTTYKSPWNIEEETASCFVFKNNRWDGKNPLREFNYKDNSSGNGGNIFHFMMNYLNISFTESKQKINELLGADYQEHNRPTEKLLATALDEKTKTAPSFSFNQQKENEIKIKKVQSLQNKALTGYLKERGISQKIAEKYLSEIYYEIDKNYFAISFVNDSGGREVRNKYFKGSFGKKDITRIRPTPKIETTVKIFEGFMDFLSYLEMNKTAPLVHYFILNSASLKERALNALSANYETIDLYFDNDRAGDETTDFFINNLKNKVVELKDKRRFYSDFKDVNELLVSKNV